MNMFTLFLIKLNRERIILRLYLNSFTFKIDYIRDKIFFFILYKYNFLELLYKLQNFFKFQYNFIITF